MICQLFNIEKKSGFQGFTVFEYQYVPWIKVQYNFNSNALNSLTTILKSYNRKHH